MLHAQGGSGRCDSRLEMAVLYYIKNFRKAFITDGRSLTPLSLSDVPTSSKERVSLSSTSLSHTRASALACL